MVLETNRRNFLKMFGVTVAAAAVTTAVTPAMSILNQIEQLEPSLQPTVGFFFEKAGITYKIGEIKSIEVESPPPIEASFGGLIPSRQFKAMSNGPTKISVSGEIKICDQVGVKHLRDIVYSSDAAIDKVFLYFDYHTNFVKIDLNKSFISNIQIQLVRLVDSEDLITPMEQRVFATYDTEILLIERTAKISTWDKYGKKTSAFETKIG